MNIYINVHVLLSSMYIHIIHTHVTCRFTELPCIFCRKYTCMYTQIVLFPVQDARQLCEKQMVLKLSLKAAEIMEGGEYLIMYTYVYTSLTPLSIHFSSPLSIVGYLIVLYLHVHVSVPPCLSPLSTALQ